MLIRGIANTILDHFGLYALFAEPIFNRQIKCKHILGTCLKASTIPLFRIAIGRARLTDKAVNRFNAHIDHDIIDGFSVHNIAALFVNHLTLIIHHIIIFDDLFANVIIARFNFFLRGFNGL